MAVVCPICGKRFKNKRALAAHMRIHKSSEASGRDVTVTRRKGVIVVHANVDKDVEPEEIRIYLKTYRKRKKKGGDTAVARIFDEGSLVFRKKKKR